MKKSLDLTGQRFSRLVAVRKVSAKPVRWLFACDCGKEKTIISRNVRRGQTKSCGCMNSELTSSFGSRVSKKIAHQRFGRLTAITPTPFRVATGGIKWRCVCDCGVTCFVGASNLISGHTKSCGCLRLDVISAKAEQRFNSPVHTCTRCGATKPNADFKYGKARERMRFSSHCRECINAAQNAAYQANPRPKIEAAARYVALNKELCKARRDAYYNANKQMLYEKSKKWKMAHPDEVKRMQYESSARSRNMLSDAYVRSQLLNPHLRAVGIPQSLVEVKRQQLLIHRKLKERNEQHHRVAK